MSDGRVTGTGDEDAPSWRNDGLRAMLSVAAVAAPLASLASIFLRRPPGPPLDTAVIGLVGVLLPILRLWPGVSPKRAGGAMVILVAVGTFVLARVGLTSGVALIFASAVVFGALYFGRRQSYVLIAIGGLAYLVVGTLIARGVLAPPPSIADPTQLQNWIRAGSVYVLITSLIASGITFALGRTEASARDLRVAYERLGQLHLRLESSKEEERRFLAHELHDEFGQLLTALKLRIQAAARGVAAGAPEADPVSVIDDLIARVRRMSGNLRPPLLDEVGLVPAVRAYLATQAATSGVAMVLESDDERAARLDPQLEITCFRIVQEAVTNAMRHAAARDLRVRIDRRADRVALRIHDDGRGFDVGVRLEGAAAAGHLGVVGMRERVRAHGGGFRLHSRPGDGTTIEVELPLAFRSPVAVGS
ncbi:MAG TPA: sensor histidine kinase [Polyangia bacterium]|jgi:signal transduction histidine kinase|nr:sensor histidine kinase [Polyangia bacterium]